MPKPITIGNQIIFISPGVFNDAGGFEIARGADGKLHVVPVPPWDGPFTAKALNAVISTLTLAAVTDKPALRSALEDVAAAITEGYSTEISNWAQKAPLRTFEGAAGA
jgi:hypothetical protein